MESGRLDRALHSLLKFSVDMLRLVLGFLAVALLASCENAPAPPAMDVVEIPTGKTALRGFVWTPQGRGPFAAVLFNHGRPDTPEQHLDQRSAQLIGPIFARHGYVFLYLFRHGEGLSARSGRFVGDELDAAERAGGHAARNRRQLELLEGFHLADGLAGIAYLRSRGDVDRRRIAVIGHSYGGQIALLEAERDKSLRAVVTFGAAAGSWGGSRELRERLLRASARIEAPALLIHAANDYSTEPGRALAAELARLGKPYCLKIYGPIGNTAGEAHSYLYWDYRWEADVFPFLDWALGSAARSPGSQRPQCPLRVESRRLEQSSNVMFGPSSQNNEDYPTRQ